LTYQVIIRPAFTYTTFKINQRTPNLSFKRDAAKSSAPINSALYVNMKFTAIEQEVIFLKTINESIDSMVNHEILKLSEGVDGAQAIFKTAIHQRFFNIILVDFLSKSASEVTGKNISCSDALAEICEKPNFNQHNSIKLLKRAVTAFKKWLDREIKVKVWLASIGLETMLRVQRQEFIKICGDISKHNFSRLSRRVNDLKNILSRSAVQLSDEDGLLIIDDFYERFHTDIFSYHGSHLVEQLNNIRWGIQEYLQPEFKRSIVYEGGKPPKYSYTYPIGINTAFAKNCYWGKIKGN
jgi:hypothetical protein